LSSSSQLLRLRKDIRNRVTYKGPGTIEDGVRSRVEIEFEVDNYENARILFENLGYEVIMVYEKFRTTYALDDAEIVLDEMPYGNFIEIEASDPEVIHSLADKLNLDWEARIFDSYTVLFDFLKWTRGFQFRDLSFENFTSLEISPQDLGLRYADTP
ncbi:MAG: CYTH domain-containing protein, partial [Aliifodinibius sp.]|nr:class IV adenylate cyclase [candidate division Zixibacteria bacterium]NIT59735.1 class IV adenylate cyclase [Fodinibius sp.]NIR66017.1 class IV adenylate cyclase [candidate division Zixibacteria bacterium]NIS47653.1 class IV adenylate cyclase [candidate division Zixibacteria bacterium]NIU15749.1 class IV adenylate cyclase [candidate division Zixibacteria bacterium]